MTNIPNGMGADPSASGNSQPESAHDAPSIPFRKLPKDGYFFQENEFTDIYSPIVGPFATTIYDALCRNSYGSPTVEYSVRDLAHGMSPTSASRAVQILEIVGLLKRLPTSGNRKSVCQLFDVKALAESQGAMRERKSGHLELPVATADRLKAQVKAVRQSQQGRAKAREILTGKKNAEIAVQNGFHSIFSVSQRDASVSHLIRQRATRETQTGTHLIQEEVRNEEVPTPSPPPSHDSEAQKDKDAPDKDEPERLLKVAQATFTGVMNDLGDYLFDTSRPPLSHIANGAAEWGRFGFNSLAVDAAKWRGEVLMLVLSASDPVAAQRGLEKYRKRWGASVRKWFGCEVEISFQHQFAKGERDNSELDSFVLERINGEIAKVAARLTMP